MVTKSRWLKDFDVESAPLTTTGGRVWDAAYGLFDFLEILNAEGRQWCDVGPGFLNNSRILELGAGCGWLGCNLARNLPSTSFILTEQEVGGALDWLKHNITRGDFPNVTARPLDWSLPDHDVQGPWDLIIGSDLVYNEIGARLLPKVMHAQATSSTDTNASIIPKGIFYAHTFHRFDQFDELFLECAEKEGLDVCEIPYDPIAQVIGEELKTVEETFMEELFPEKRLAFLYIVPKR